MKYLFTFVVASLMGLGAYSQTTAYVVHLTDADYLSGKEVRMKDRAARHTEMIKMVDSIVALRTFRFTPQTIQVQPSGEMYPIHSAALTQNNAWYVQGPQMLTSQSQINPYAVEPVGTTPVQSQLATPIPQLSGLAQGVSVDPAAPALSAPAGVAGFGTSNPVVMNQTDFQVVFKPTFTDIVLPYIIGVTPPYRNVLLNGVMPEVNNYKAISNEGGWVITFNSNVYTENDHTFKLTINSLTRSATLTITTPDFNPVVYMGIIAQL